jgi:hypothetical protein
MALSRQQQFQQHYKHHLSNIRKETAVYVGDTITAYRGNTTGERSRKRVRELAREIARQAMRYEAMSS